MPRPALLLIDDDADVLSAIARDMRREYGRRFQVFRASSAEEGLERVQQLKKKNASVALFLVDQRMPRQTGVDFLEQAGPLFPDAKRALLTAYADTDAAIQAINRAHVDHYLQKPWDPPEEKLFPVVSELLDEWEAVHIPPFNGVRVFGHRWSPAAFRIKDFLARNHVPYQWLDLARGPEGPQLLEEKGLTDEPLPVVLFTDGTHLAAPTPAQVGERVGLRSRAELRFYPFVIVGAGPAGLAAAVYAESEGVETLLVEQDAPGGQAGQSSRIENYLGFPSGVQGAELARRAVAQAKKFGVELLTPQCVVGVRVEGPVRWLRLADGEEVSCHTLLVATGVSYRTLEADGVSELAGRGVYYGAAATEARSSKGEEVYVVGGGNSAGQAALYLARFAAAVTIVVRRDGLAETMSRYLIKQIQETPNIRLRTRSRIVAARGKEHLERLVIRDNATDDEETVEATGLFIFIGATPHTDWLEGVVARDAHGFLLTGADLMTDGSRPRGWPLKRDPYLLETSVPGIFAAGDVRSGSIKRVASGVGEGSMTVSFVHQYLAGL